MIARIQLSLVLTLCVTCAPLAYGADPWHESFNKASALPYRNNFLGGMAIGTGAVDGPAVFPETSETKAFGGTITASGSADHDDLKLYLKMTGEVADHRASAISHSIYNISDPSVAPGTSGTMYLNYSFGGITSIDGGTGNSVTYSLSINHNVENTGIGGTLLDFKQKTVEALSAVATPTGMTNTSVAVPFNYNEDFRITTRFDVRILSDLEYDFIGTNYVLSQDSTFQSITAAFDNSATLDAIFLPDGASIGLNSATGFDLSPLVQFGVPIPLPAPLTMLIPALTIILSAPRRKARK